MATLHVTATETINSPVAEVWELASDTSRYAEWVPVTLEVTRTDGPARLGVTYDERNKVVGPITATSRWTVTEFEPMRRQVHRDESIPFMKALDLVMEFETVEDDSTRVTLSIQGESALGPVGALLVAARQGSFAKDNQTTLRNLKAMCEG